MAERIYEDYDHVVEWLFGLRDRVKDEDRPADVAALRVDLEDRACPACRTTWPPWQRACPADGAATIPASHLGPQQTALPLPEAWREE